MNDEASDEPDFVGGRARWWLRRSSCGLLVSVRDAAEAVAAVGGGAEVIDVKEPARGPLGAADAEVAAAVAAAVGTGVPWTLACGELKEGGARLRDRLRRTLAGLTKDAPPPAAVKSGLAGITEAELPARLAAFRDAVPAEIEPVAVAYADWEQATAPRPAVVVAAAAAAGFALLLIDTWLKDGTTVFGPADAPRDVAGWVRRGREAGLGVVLAGSLATATVPAALACRPDFIAVRSAACVGGRLGKVCGKRVRSLGRLLRSASRERPPPDCAEENGREIARSAGAARPRPRRGSSSPRRRRRAGS